MMYSGQRRLAAIMFTDMVGFTSVGQENEALSLELLEEQRRLVRPIIGRYDGKEIKTIGDAFLIEFPSALQAVRCAFDIQQSIHEFNAHNSAGRNLSLRIGIHLGDVTQSENDIYGDAVNVASRIEPLADPGSICITQQVYDQIKNKFEFPFSSLGKKELKNVSEPVMIYSVVLPWQKVRDVEASDFSKRIAVLPFTNMIPDPNDEYFADGMTEEMISTISKISGIEVVSRTSVMQYKQIPKPIKEVSRELEVGVVLEGSVRKAGNKLRVSVQMIDAIRDRHIWAENYDREMQNVFEIQLDIAQRVAEALADKTMSKSSPRDAQELTNPEAFEHYLRGRYFWNQKELDGFNKALVEFGKAIEKDPRLAQGYAGLADTYLLLGRNGHVLPKFAYPKAIENAQKAIALDPRLPDPHTALGAILQEYEWKWDEAGNEFQRAIALNPSYATGRSWYALYLGHLGRFEEALDEIRLAQKLDPLSPRIHCVASEEYLFARMYDKCIEAAERALEINPNFGGAYGYRAYPLVEKKMYDKAIDDFQEAGRQQGARAWMGRLGHAYAISGNRTEATKIVEKLKTETNQPPPKSPFLPPPPNAAFDIGLVYLGLGDKVQAIEWFEKAADARTAEIIHVKCEPIYDNLRDEPRFQKLIEHIGLGS